MAGQGHVIVLGNEKGGSGKSTTAMHLCIALLRGEKSVGIIDLDLRQKSFTRYLDNRKSYARRTGARLLEPARASAEASLASDAAREKLERLEASIEELQRACDFVIIDTPGAATPFNISAHQFADTLVTPINDSLIDFDLLGTVDPESGKVLGPSIYSELVWEARQRRAANGKTPTDWVVLRNRISVVESRNRRQVSRVMGELSNRIGFRIIPGFSERVIFRELFLSGLTLLDLKKGEQTPLTLSHVAARQEVRDMVKELRLPNVGPVR